MSLIPPFREKDLIIICNDFFSLICSHRFFNVLSIILFDRYDGLSEPSCHKKLFSFELLYRRFVPFLLLALPK
jgi:hypothetical protein